MDHTGDIGPPESIARCIAVLPFTGVQIDPAGVLVLLILKFHRVTSFEYKDLDFYSPEKWIY